MKNLVSLLLFGMLVLSSCNTSKNIVYMQDVIPDTPERTEENLGIVIQPKDMLSIVVSSKDPELAAMFNLPVVSYQAGSEMTSTGSQYRLLGYVVDNDGDIDFPILGKMNVSGLTRWQLSEKVKTQLIESDMVKDAVVTVQFMNFRVSVMGEVSAPGTYDIDGDRVTLLQALSKARDLTIYGKRDGVYVIRETDGERIIYQVDLRSVDLFASPAYYLQQNDIVYVEPNKVRAGQSTINENTFKSTSFWISFTSLVATIINILL